jgi:hypothetical protein
VFQPDTNNPDCRGALLTIVACCLSAHQGCYLAPRDGGSEWCAWLHPRKRLNRLIFLTHWPSGHSILLAFKTCCSPRSTVRHQKGNNRCTINDGFGAGIYRTEFRALPAPGTMCPGQSCPPRPRESRSKSFSARGNSHPEHLPQTTCDDCIARFVLAHKQCVS